jgi:hypothetical protein
VQDKFWRTIAALMCVGLFYVGHGLHSSQCAGLPSLENTADAAGVAWHTDSPEMFTASEDGRTVYTWKRFKDVREGTIVVRYVVRTNVLEHPERKAPGQSGFGRAPVPEPTPRQAPEQPAFKK